MTSRVCIDCGMKEEVQVINPAPKCKRCKAKEYQKSRYVKNEIRDKRSREWK